MREAFDEASSSSVRDGKDDAVLLEEARSHIRILEKRLVASELAQERSERALRDLRTDYRRYRKEYEGLVRSRGARLLFALRKMLGRPYEPTSMPPSFDNRKIKPEGLARILASKWKQFAAEIPTSNGSDYYEKAPLRVGIITDEYMFNYYKDALNVISITADDYRREIEEGNLDLLLYVTCWLWHPSVPKKGWSPIEAVCDAFDIARSCGIKTAFQSIEDPIDYIRFLPIAKKADVVFTADDASASQYVLDCSNERVFVLPYGVNPLFHNPVGLSCKQKIENGIFSSGVFFAGSWYAMFPQRCEDTSMLFDGVLDDSMRDLVIVDRNSDRPFSQAYDRCFPAKYRPCIIRAIPHDDLQQVHKLFDYSLCINTVKDSPTMCAMRVYELQAIGSLLLSNYSQAVSSRFPATFMALEAREVPRILEGYTKREILSMQIEGIRRMFSGNTVYDRLNEMFEALGESFRFPVKKVALLCDEAAKRALEDAPEPQTYANCEIVDIESVDAVTLGERFDYALVIDESVVAYPWFVEDAVNAFKYTDVDFVAFADENELDASFSYVEGASSNSGVLYSLSKVSFEAMESDERRLHAKGFLVPRTRWGRDTSATPKELGVIIPIYNNGRYLEDRCFRSLLRSSIFDKMRIYLVDDGSDDSETIAAIKRLARNFDNVNAIFFDGPPSGSPSRPRNRALELCCEPYVAYIDPDDEAVNDGYATLLERVKNNNVDFAMGTTLMVNALHESGAELKCEFAPGLNNGGVEALLRIRFIAQNIQAAVYKRSFLVNAELKNLEGAVGEDTFYFYEMMMEADSFYYEHLPIFVYYADREGSLTHHISRDFFDKSLSLEKHQVKVLKDRGILDEYRRIRLNDFLNGWYREKLALTKVEDYAYCASILEEIERLYRIED